MVDLPVMKRIAVFPATWKKRSQRRTTPVPRGRMTNSTNQPRLVPSNAAAIRPSATMSPPRHTSPRFVVLDADGLGQSPVDNQRFPVLAKHDVAGLQIAVQDPRLCA
jgi:hypothetical protein